MTFPAEPASGSTPRPEDRLLDLLPAHLSIRDEQTGGALRALLSAVAGELEVLEADLEDLYDGWFVETCAEWVVPYLGDLVGLTEPVPNLGAEVSRRGVVANTVAYRRRKGTVAVLEKVGRDVTGWPARAVEYFQLLAASTHINHVRIDRPATASLRGAARLDRTGAAQDLRAHRSTEPPQLIDLYRGAFDPLAHTVEVRRIECGRGRYGIPQVGIFLFPLQTYEVGSAHSGGTGSSGGWSQARPVDDGYTVDPLGRSTPLFAVPRAETAIEQLAHEEHLPLPLRPRRLLALLQEARRGELDVAELPIAVRIGGEGQDLPPELLRVCGLEDLGPADDPQVTVDALNGRLRVYRGGSPHTPDDAIFVRYAHGSLADVGAGTYDRSEIHERVLATDLYGGPPGVAGQVAVRSGAEPSELVVSSVAAGLERARLAWAGPGSLAQATYVVSIGDSATYPGDLSIDIPEATRLVLVAASWPERETLDGLTVPPAPGAYAPEGLRPHLRGSLTVTGGPGSSLVLDGIVLEGDLTVAPGRLEGLSLSQCTFSGRVTVAADNAGTGTYDNGGNSTLRIGLVRSVLRGVELASTVPLLAVTDCIVDGGPGAVALSAPGAHASIEGSTVRGTLSVRSIDASSSVFDGPVVAEHRQVGCLRYCFVRPPSRVPRRFRCVPGDGASPGTEPVYASDDPGSPLYLALARGCPAAIAKGGEGGAEMGVHHHLRRPLRVHAARQHLATYLPVGLEIGIFGS